MFLVGFMGAGKTSVGRALAQQLNWLFEDLDDHIERSEQRSVAEIFRDSGEDAFRQAEHAALRRVLEDSLAALPKIIALGGGAFAQPANVTLLNEAAVPTVFLDASVAQSWDRCCRQSTENGIERPLLKSLEEFEKLYHRRRGSYLKAAMTIDTNGRLVNEIADEIVEKLKLKKIAIRIEEGEVE